MINRPKAMNTKLKRLLELGLAAALSVACSGGYDDSALLERLEELEHRASLLEDRCARINTNIAALQGLASIAASSDRIKTVSPITEGGRITGYVFTFCFSGPITVYCAADGRNGTDGTDGYNGRDGADGTDGVVPTVGVKEEGGEKYWTLDGEFILDDEGHRIPLVTSGGTVVDGVTPELKVEDGVWFYRMGASGAWIRFDVKAEYGDGNVFLSVGQDNDNVVFTLADGSAITIPKVKSLSLAVSPAGDVAISAGGTAVLDWTLSAEAGEAEVDAFAQGRWTAVVNRSDGSAPAGRLSVTAPADAEGSCQVILFATGSDGLSVYETIRFTVL